MNKSEIIHELGRRSATMEHELILEMLKFYEVTGTRDLTEEQVRAFAEGKGICTM